MIDDAEECEPTKSPQCDPGCRRYQDCTPDGRSDCLDSVPYVTRLGAGSESEQFGSSLAVSTHVVENGGVQPGPDVPVPGGEGNDDGEQVTHVSIGARAYKTGGIRHGAGYFYRATENNSFVQLGPPTPQLPDIAGLSASDNFGYSVCVNEHIGFVGGYRYNNEQGAVAIKVLDVPNFIGGEVFSFGLPDGPVRFGGSISCTNNGWLAVGAYLGANADDSTGAMYLYGFRRADIEPVGPFVIGEPGTAWYGLNSNMNESYWWWVPKRRLFL